MIFKMLKSIKSFVINTVMISLVIIITTLIATGEITAEKGLLSIGGIIALGIIARMIAFGFKIIGLVITIVVIVATLISMGIIK